MLTQKRLKELLHYDPETGDWIWINAPSHNTRLNGKPAGTTRSDGYRTIRIGGTAYYTSRLAILYMTGEWPEEEADHEDRNPRNEKWSNLRPASSSQNKYNRSLSSDGYRGVYPCGNKWQVQVGGCYLGIFDELEEAIAARDVTAFEWSDGYAILNSGEPQP